MNSIIVICPHCGAKLAVPGNNVRPKVRCGRCKEKFVLNQPKPKPVEDVVASWLSDEQDAGGQEPSFDGSDINLDESLLNVGDPSATVSGEALDPDPAPSSPAETPADGARKDARIVKVDGHGTLIEFAPGLLRKPEFRAGFPRQCVKCDSRAHLQAHVVIYSAQLVDSVSMEAEHKAGALMLSNEDVQGLSDLQVLDRLPAVPNVPHPADLPMPYWVCDMCGPSGQVSGQIRVNPETGGGFCRLLIRNPRRALAFIDAALSQNVEGYNLVKERVDQLVENPWDNLADGVQHRIQQWFQPRPGEQFLAYAPDRDHARTEDGMAGVVVTNQRLIAHFSRRHREATADEPIELTHATGVGKGHVSIKTANWNIPKMSIDRDGIARLRRGLSLGKFKAIWH